MEVLVSALFQPPSLHRHRNGMTYVPTWSSQRSSKGWSVGGTPSWLKALRRCCLVAILFRNRAALLPDLRGAIPFAAAGTTTQLAPAAHQKVRCSSPHSSHLYGTRVCPWAARTRF